MPDPPSVLALVRDLMFMVKIKDAAKSVGLPIRFFKTVADVEAGVAGHPSLILFDLNLAGADMLALIRKLKSDTLTKDIHLVGFISHVQIETRAAAEAAGCDMVVARSVFSQRLPEILGKYGVART